jgi:hypothetical protein
MECILSSSLTHSNKMRAVSVVLLLLLALCHMGAASPYVYRRLEEAGTGSNETVDTGKVTVSDLYLTD